MNPTQLIWCVPLAALGLMSLALLRPEPVVEPDVPAHAVTVTDSIGDRVPVPMPPLGVASVHLDEYLPQTHAPALLLRAGTSRDREKFLAGRWAELFPELADGHYWKDEYPFNFESLIAEEPGVLHFGFIWLGGDRYGAADLRRFGVTALSTFVSEDFQPPDPPLLRAPKLEDSEYHMFGWIRTMNAALGQPEFGDRVIAEYLDAIHTLHEELRPETIPEAERPRVLGLFAPMDDWSRMAVSSDDNPRLATRGTAKKLRASGRDQEAERVLAMNPDILMGNPRELYQDVRWRGLKAVQERRVYASHPDFNRFNHDLDNLPLAARWLSEIFHPDRLEPTVREHIRAYYLKRYGFELSDGRIDELLCVEVNKDSRGYARFQRTHP
ncbi:MAG: hypothetical protein WDO56_15345 [Gammaproteobacteria bacterium]